MYKYHIFGYNVLSDIELVCYQTDFQQEDIAFKIIDSAFEEQLRERARHQSEQKDKTFVFDIEF